MDTIINNLSESQLSLLYSYNLINSNQKLKELAEYIYKNPNEKNKPFIEKTTSEINNINTVLNSKKPVKIYIDGVFDIIHSGHFNAIRQAKKLGDICLCGVNSDEDVLKVKGPTLMDDKERCALAFACKWCDEVAEKTPYTPTLATLDKYNCDYLSHGDDIPYNEKGECCYDEIIKVNRMKLFKRTEGVSSTEIMRRLLLCAKDKIPEVAQLEEFEKNKKPVMSSLLATSWRIKEFSNNKIPKEGDKIIYIDGDFDLLHIGHVEALKQAKALGDFLYVGIHDDATVNKHKGKNFPILNLNERVFNTLALKNVDEVIIGAPWNITEDMIKTLHIDVVVGTDDDENKRFDVPKKLGIFKKLKLDYKLDNSVFIERIIKNKDAYIKKYLIKAKKDEVFFDKDPKNEVKEI
jgi:ethanolamine-phosphate cytidylyltransferase